MRGSQPKHRDPLIDALLQDRHTSPNKQCVSVLNNLDAHQDQMVPGSLSTSMLDQLS
jgi:hypothetical protein